MKKSLTVILALTLAVCAAACGAAAETEERAPQASGLQGFWHAIEYSGEDVRDNCLYVAFTDTEMTAYEEGEASEAFAYTAENGLLLIQDEDIEIGYLLEGDTLTLTQAASEEEQESILFRQSSREEMDAQVAEIVAARVAEYLPRLLDRGWIFMDVFAGYGREESEDPLYGCNMLLFHEDGTYVLSGAENSDFGVRQQHL